MTHAGPDPKMQYGLLYASQRFAHTPQRPVVAASKRLFTVADLELAGGEEVAGLLLRLLPWLDKRLTSLKKRAMMEAVAQDEDDDL